MKNTVTAIKGDIGDIGGHFAPSQAVLTEVKRTFDEKGKGLISDHSIGHTGGDTAIIVTHEWGQRDGAPILGMPFRWKPVLPRNRGRSRSCPTFKGQSCKLG